MAGHFFKDHTPSAIQGEARLRGTRRCSCGLKPFLSAWKPLRGWRVRHLPRAESALCGVGLVRYPARAVGLKPSASQGEARLRGTRRCSCGLKPFLSAWKPLRGWRVRHLPRAEGALCGVDLVRYPARAVGLKPSASQGEARLRGRERIIFSKTIRPPEARAILPNCRHPGCGGGDAPYHPCSSVISVPIRVLFRLSDAKPACTERELQR